MKILLLGDGGSIHLKKWAISLKKEGFGIGIFSLSEFDAEAYTDLGILVLSKGKQFDHIAHKEDGKLIKGLYLSKLTSLKRAIRQFAPDILHAHYASSYGLLGALTGFHPYIISVWGSDVYDFPLKSFLHRQMLKFSLKTADKILSTSHVMARQTNKFSGKKITVTPFGVDTAVFRPVDRGLLFAKDDIVIGTIKTLEDKYGIEYLIGAFNINVQRHPELPLKLLIVGEGSKRKQLEDLAAKYSLTDKVTFTGKIAHAEVVKYYNELDIYVALSTLDSESFGVAIVEASACAVPVVVSSVGGLPEVVIQDETGLIVDKKDTQAAAEAIERLILNPELRKEMGERGREHVLSVYDWDLNLRQMSEIYAAVLSHS